MIYTFSSKVDMRFNTVTAYALVILSISLFTGCASISHFFRNHDFDYASYPLEQNKPLEVPKSILTAPNIHPALVISEVQISFTKNQ